MAGKRHIPVRQHSCFQRVISDKSFRWFWQSNRYITLKIVVSDAENGANHEAAISKHLGTNPTHKGFRFVRGVIDHFEILGPDGKHQCLVYEPMRETMTLLQRRFKNGKIPVFLLKEYMMHLLLALDYLHSECHIIHTGEQIGPAYLIVLVLLVLTLNSYRRYQARQHFDGVRRSVCT